MDIIRYINDKEITGEMPDLKVENQGIIQVIKDLRIRIMQENNAAKQQPVRK